jgi:RHS repeat-associated protein
MYTISFGQIISQTGSITNPYTYTGREYDKETGMYYHRARYYDPKIGRFITTDPLNLAKLILLKQDSSERVKYFAERVYSYALIYPQVFNEYLYVVNNPVNLTDPWGLLTFWGPPIGGCPPKVYCVDPGYELPPPQENPFDRWGPVPRPGEPPKFPYLPPIVPWRDHPKPSPDTEPSGPGCSK